MTDTQLRDTLVCSGCDSLTPAADSFWLFRLPRGDDRIPEHECWWQDAFRVRVDGTYCRACAERHDKGETLPKSRFPRLASFSIDGKTWTACDLRDTPS